MLGSGKRCIARCDIAPAGCALVTLVAATVFLTGCATSGTLPPASLRRGDLVEVEVHGVSLESNAAGISADRRTAIYLPPSYRTGGRRYPVVYLLHGIFDSYRVWLDAWPGTAPGDGQHATIQGILDQGIHDGSISEMIVVVPDADKTCHYTDSEVKGRWTAFVGRDLVSYVDAHFRTEATPGSRAIIGHSMGGHGALKVAMLMPNVFSTVYAMSPSLVDAGEDVSVENPAMARAARLLTARDIEGSGFYEKAVVGVSQCFTPDLGKAHMAALPFIIDSSGKSVQGPMSDRWVGQLPIRMAVRHATNLRGLRGLRFDAGLADEFAHIPPSAVRFSKVLDSLGVSHTLELYNGDHRNRLWGRDGRLAREVLPWVSSLLTDSTVPQPVADARVEADSPASASAQARLWRAAQQGDIPTAMAALRDGADVNALDTVLTRSGRRPLNYAAENDLVAMVKWLVANGAGLDLQNRTGFTALHHAAEYGKLQTARALVEAGAKLDVRLPSGSTPELVARQRGHSEVAQFLASLRGRQP